MSSGLVVDVTGDAEAITIKGGEIAWKSVSVNTRLLLITRHAIMRTTPGVRPTL